jgi:hypothetical protein
MAEDALKGRGALPRHVHFAREVSMVEPVKEPITGREEPIDPATPTGALAEFYRAFNRRDLRLMEANWHADDEASMDNPLGGIRRGWDDIRTVYERIFTGKARVAIEFYGELSG